MTYPIGFTWVANGFSFLVLSGKPSRVPPLPGPARMRNATRVQHAGHDDPPVRPMKLPSALALFCCPLLTLAFLVWILA